jgi:FtsH-binding integral membrane protein
MSGTEVCIRSAIVFTVQILTAIGIVIASFVNLSIGNPDYHDLWLVLLASGIGYIFPSPSIKKRKCETMVTQV